MVSPPQGASSQRHLLGGGRWLCRRPGGRAHGGRLLADPVGGRPRDHRVEPEPCGCRAADAPVVPLPWCVEPELRPGLFNGRFQWPALEEPGRDRHGVESPCRCQPCLGCTLPGRLTAEGPPTRHRRQTRVIPDGGGGSAVDPPCVLAIPRRPGDPRPGGGWGLDEGRARWQAPPLLAGRPFGVGCRGGAGA